MDSLVADYGSGTDTSENEYSSDSSSTDTVPTDKTPVESQAKKPALPPPAFDDNSASIFTNPYIEAENAKSAILEKHVKMIPSKEFITEINGKKICWMYRKGRCRFGNNCKYAHDSELYNQDQAATKDNPDPEQASSASLNDFPPSGFPPFQPTPGSNPPPGFPSFQPSPGSNPPPGFPPYQSGTRDFKPHRNNAGFPPFQTTPGKTCPSRNIENEDDASQKRKKRPGLSQSIVPSKKVMNMYYSSSSK